MRAVYDSTSRVFVNKKVLQKGVARITSHNFVL